MQSVGASEVLNKEEVIKMVKERVIVRHMFQYRDLWNGQFVSRLYALEHPDRVSEERIVLIIKDPSF